MKIGIIGSMQFTDKMLEVRNKLQRAEQSGSDLEIEKYKKNYHLISQQIDKIKNKNEE